MTDNFANTEPVPTAIISRESVEGTIALLLGLKKILAATDLQTLSTW